MFNKICRLPLIFINLIFINIHADSGIIKNGKFEFIDGDIFDYIAMQYDRDEINDGDSTDQVPLELKTEISQEKKDKAELYLIDFIRQAKKVNSWKELEENFDACSKKIDVLFEDESKEKVDHYLEKESPSRLYGPIYQIFVEKRKQFQDEFLKNNGLFVISLTEGRTPQYYWVKFETEQKYFSFLQLKWMRTLRYKIEHDPLLRKPSKNFEDVDLVLLNKDEFEIERFPIGTVKCLKNTTGKLDLRESEYKEIHRVELHSKSKQK